MAIVSLFGLVSGPGVWLSALCAVPDMAHKGRGGLSWFIAVMHAIVL
jgi:hypothetical protein